MFICMPTVAIDVEEGGASRRAGAFELACAREGSSSPKVVASTTIQKNSLASDRRSAHSTPVKAPARRRSQRMREASRAESQSQHDHEIRERGNALMLETQALHAFAERGDRRGVGLQACDRVAGDSRPSTAARPSTGRRTAHPPRPSRQKTFGSIWKTSFMAAWLAAPPIQLPAIAVMPRHSSGSTLAGASVFQMSSATGPPSMTLSVRRRTSRGPSGRGATWPADRWRASGGRASLAADTSRRRSRAWNARRRSIRRSCRAPAGNSRAPAPARTGRSVARTAARARGPEDCAQRRRQQPENDGVVADHGRRVGRKAARWRARWNRARDRCDW